MRRFSFVLGGLALVAAAVSAWAIVDLTRTPARARGVSSAAATPGTTTGSRSGSGTRTARLASTERDPIADAAVRRAVAGRVGSVTAAVEDLRTGRTWTYRSGQRDQTASVMKLDILETLLHDQQAKGIAPGTAAAATMQGMIENSDDDDASDLWDAVGAASGIAAYDARAGLTQTVPHDDGYWGESTTSALDQIRLLRQVVGPSALRGRPALLDRPARDYALDLMEHVEADQAWGVSGGVPTGIVVALKNGWVPLTSDAVWEINSVGLVRGDGRHYLIAVLTRDDPSEGYGIATIERVSRLVWSSLRASA